MIEEVEDAIGRPVSRETFDQLRLFAEKVIVASKEQNLVSGATVDQLWVRHLLDSAQLIRLAPPSRNWLDVGSGAGLPGVVIAILTNDRVTLVEPRRLRAAFLQGVVEDFKLNASVEAVKVERLRGAFDVITARAVARLPKLLAMAHHLSGPSTRWILPKGRSWKSELEEAQESWHYDLRAVPSITDPEAEILVLDNVRAKSSK